jgi:hypothetical protein
LQTNEDQDYVFTIVNGKTVIRNIKILGQSETSTAVDGVEDDAQVIMNPPPGLLEGVSVQVIAGAVAAVATPPATAQGVSTPAGTKGTDGSSTVKP